MWNTGKYARNAKIAEALLFVSMVDYALVAMSKQSRNEGGHVYFLFLYINCITIKMEIYRIGHTCLELSCQYQAKVHLHKGPSARALASRTNCVPKFINARRVANK